MDFGFSQEQEMLRATARKFLENECASTFVRARMEEPAGVTDEFWAKLAEQGWLGLVYPEEYGGSGLGFVDLTVLMEEMGRAVMPGPFVSTVLLGGLTILEAGSPAQKKEWLAKIAAGRAKATLAWTEPNARWDAAGVTLGARADKGGFVLSGTKLFVPDAHLADVLVVAARTGEGKSPEEGVSLFLVPKGARGLEVTLLPTMDQTRKLCEVGFKDTAVPAGALLGEKGGGWAPLRRVIERATVALCAEMCGGAQKVLEMTTEYAKIRVAFGKPIGTYQGVKHKAADMLVDVENAKSLTYYAAWAMDENVPEAALAASMAKAYVSDAYRKVSGTGIQLHGGIGFTWEHDLHLYFKRAKSSEFTFGDATYHRERVAQLINL
ncbi:MAG: acyl-CoA/acyl-ACP dehydrogenase, partial [Candidatus Rokubacteria bacterium]|nr:acyl-CoA/acyl-ACP dehydrogenase [Candidatus Rokubacteria bacterium]MBI2492273.1 acyl-CoA/acyl-ACP dehydrogenase [Candidatus Rokubacteria bacterium]MBI4255817.1 acyl-CoA/acyl-ACP dehydrogenase [Candidatus Rokubacteria bacterium]